MCDSFIRITAALYIKSASSLSKGCGHYYAVTPISGILCLSE